MLGLQEKTIDEEQFCEWTVLGQKNIKPNC